MPKLKNVSTAAAGLKDPSNTTLFVERRVGELVRRVGAFAGHRSLSSFIEEMLILYIQQRHPELEMSFVEEDKPAPSPAVERRSSPRRKKTGTSALYSESKNRRGGSDRRKV